MCEIPTSHIPISHIRLEDMHATGYNDSMFKKRILNRNIILGYFLVACMNSVFWMGTWLLYYLNFTDYKGIGLIMAFSVAVKVLLEIPTGAIADLLGKKITLFFAFLFAAIGELLMARIDSVASVLPAGFFIFLGYALYSGAMEALMYDTLVEEKREADFSKVIGRMTSIAIVMTAVAAIAGGFLYEIDIRLPNIAVGVFRIFGVILTLFLIEPVVDSEKFSWRAFIRQNKRGLQNLFEPKFRNIAMIALTIGIFFTINIEILDDTLVVEYGYSGRSIGLLYASLSILSATLSLLYARFVKKITPVDLLVAVSIFYLITLLLTPAVGLILGTGLLFIRLPLDPIYRNSVSDIINKAVESKDRATTISTFSMLQNLPYMLTSFFIGGWMAEIGARNFAFWYGLLLALFALPQVVKYLFRRKSLRFS